MKIYVASSWRNAEQPEIVAILRTAGHEVYDFKDPAGAFHWSDIDPDWENWSAPEYIRFLTNHPEAGRGFKRDMDALQDADACVLVQPCGNSAHLELGHAVGAGLETCVLVRPGEPELMIRMCHGIVLEVAELVEWCATTDKKLAKIAAGPNPL